MTKSSMLGSGYNLEQIKKSIHCIFKESLLARPLFHLSPIVLLFPEDVIQLSGGRKIDGSVTYGSNHNGTINLYNVPNNLSGNYKSAGTPEETLQDESQKVLTTKLVSVGTGENYRL